MNVSVQQPWLIGMNMHELEMIGPRVYLNRGNQDLKLNHKPYIEKAPTRHKMWFQFILYLALYCYG